MSNEVQKTNEEWKKLLSPEKYHVTREKGTEYPFSGKYTKTKDYGTYICTCCANELFSSNTKFDSGTGWPSFFAPVSPTNIELHKDQSNGMIRTEVICKSCNAHLGHVFNDGPEPTGLRYCINSISLDFKKKS